METLDSPGFGIRDSAARLGISRPTLYAWIKSGRAKARKNAVGKLEIPKEELYYLMRQRAQRG